jgi:large subunit ribosomal protein L25
VRADVELSVIAGDIPDHITVDLAGKVIGDTLTISQVDLPKDAVPTIDRDFVIANITAPSGLRSSDDAEAAEDDASEE